MLGWRARESRATAAMYRCHDLPHVPHLEALRCARVLPPMRDMERLLGSWIMVRRGVGRGRGAADVDLNSGP